MTENDRGARFYTLIERGRQRLATEREQWERLSEAVNGFIDSDLTPGTPPDALAAGIPWQACRCRPAAACLNADIAAG